MAAELAESTLTLETWVTGAPEAVAEAIGMAPAAIGSVVGPHEEW